MGGRNGNLRWWLILPLFVWPRANARAVPAPEQVLCGVCDDTRRALFVKDAFTFADSLFQHIPGVNCPQTSFPRQACAELLFSIVEGFFCQLARAVGFVVSLSQFLR